MRNQLLKLLSRRLEILEFFVPDYLKDKDSPEIRKLVSSFEILVPPFGVTITVQSGPSKYFTRSLGLSPDKYGYDCIKPASCRYLICIYTDSDTTKTWEWIIRKAGVLVKDIVANRGICDSETEAYLFGYIVSEILWRRVSLREVLSGVSPKRKIIYDLPKTDTKIHFTTSKKYTETSDGGGVCFRIPHDSIGCVQSYMGSHEFVVMFNANLIDSPKGCVSVWAHELYHLARNTYGILNSDYYRFPDLLEMYVGASMGILKYMLWKKNFKIL